MDFFQLSQEEILTFFAVLVRFSVCMAVMPVLGDRFVPVPVKVLLSLAITMSLFPALVGGGLTPVSAAQVWGASLSGLVTMIGLEAVIGLVMGFVARFAFDTIQFGSNLVGNMMGLSAASHYDPHQESNSQVVAEVQMAIAMLLFLTLNGHHLILRASLSSYEVAGLGAVHLGESFAQGWIQLSGQVVKFGIQLAGPIAVSMFVVNVCFGLIAKSMPQMNILVLSFAVTITLGFFILWMNVPQFGAAAESLFERTGDQMQQVLKTMAEGT